MSFGLQLGKFGNQGFSGQYLLGHSAAINANLGFILGTTTIGIDALYLFSDHKRRRRPIRYTYLKKRWIPYVGAGLQSGLFGGGRALAGVQYGIDNALNFSFSLVYLPNSGLDSDLGGFLGLRYAL